MSAFSPIANPINCPWGQKAFSNYLGADQESWKQYDTVELIKSHMNERMNVLVDVVCMNAGVIVWEELTDTDMSGYC